MTDLLRYVRRGPTAGGNSIARRFLGALLWWRLWVLYAMTGVGVLALFAWTPFEPRLWGWFLGFSTATLAEVLRE